MTEESSSTPHRLGLDLGVGSVGWAVYRLDQRAEAEGWYRPSELVDLGVTIFDSGIDQDGKSAATQRRLFRSQRTHVRNTKKRKHLLLAKLIARGLLPADKAERQKQRDVLLPIGGGPEPVPAVWAWRWRAVHDQLGPHELGHTLMHLASARGIAFSSDALDDQDETGLRLSQATELAQKVVAAGCTTFGEYAAAQLATAVGTTVRARNGVENYCSRQMIREEFEMICRRQKALLSDEAWNQVREIIFDQEFTAVLPPGKCPLVPADDRLPKAHPLAQRLKMLQVLRNVELLPKRDRGIGERDPKLSGDEIRRSLLALRDKKRMSPRKLFDAIGLKGYRSNYHKSDARGGDEPETEIPGDETGAALSHDRCFGRRWFELSEERRTEIVERIIAYRENDPQTGHRTRPDYHALAEDWGIPEPNVRDALAGVVRGRSAYGRTATAALVAAIEAGKTLHEARKELYPEAEARTEIRQRLPYYGEVLKADVFDGDPSATRRTGESLTAFEERKYGRVRNPQVHVVLQQLRGLFNAIRDEYDIVEIVVELARDLCEGEDTKRKKDRQMRQRRDRRDLAKIALGDLGAANRREAIDRYMLWEELGTAAERRVDIYSGRPIPSIEVLLGPDVQVDHIIPRALSGDDSLSNKTLTFREVNKYKGDRTPAEAFSANGTYDDLKARAFDLYGRFTFDKGKQRKYRRFLETAREEFIDRGDFVGRELAATAYAAKLVRRYLEAVVPAEHVHAAHGRLTGRLRKAWNLSQALPTHVEARAIKDKAIEAEAKVSAELKRPDHRHHAIDAAVIGQVDPRTIRAFFRKTEDQAREYERPGSLENIEGLIERAIVRHRPKHKRGEVYAGAIVKATRYRIRRRADKQEGSSRQDIRGIASVNGQWQLGKTIGEFSENVLSKLVASGDFTERELEVARLTFSQPRYESILDRLALEAGTQENAITPTVHRMTAWGELCAEFIRAIGGRKSFRPWKTMEALLVLNDGKTAVESAGFAYADVVVFRKKNGNRAYRLIPVTMRDALTMAVPPMAEGETHVCRLHQGDMLRLKSPVKPAFVVVRGFKRNGLVRIVLHHNAARANGRAISFDTSIEGTTASSGDRSVSWLFGEMKARIAHIGPLGRPS